MRTKTTLAFFIVGLLLGSSVWATTMIQLDTEELAAVEEEIADIIDTLHVVKKQEEGQGTSHKAQGEEEGASEEEEGGEGEEEPDGE